MFNIIFITAVFAVHSQVYAHPVQASEPHENDISTSYDVPQARPVTENAFGPGDCDFESELLQDDDESAWKLIKRTVASATAGNPAIRSAARLFGTATNPLRSGYRSQSGTESPTADRCISHPADQSTMVEPEQRRPDQSTPGRDHYSRPGSSPSLFHTGGTLSDGSWKNYNSQFANGSGDSSKSGYPRTVSPGRRSFFGGNFGYDGRSDTESTKKDNSPDESTGDFTTADETILTDEELAQLEKAALEEAATKRWDSWRSGQADGQN